MITKLSKLILGVVALAVVMGLAGAYARRDATGVPLNIRQSRDQAFQEGGFRAAAALTGTYERTREAPPPGPATLRELVQSGEVIVTGRVLSNYGVLPAVGDVIRTHYHVQVLRVLKGEALVARQDEIVLSVLGGRANLGNGRWAQLNVRYSELPLNNQDYLLVMNRIPDDAKTRTLSLDTREADYWPVGGFAGIVRLDPDGALRPADRRKSGARPTAQHVKRQGDFINDVARLGMARTK